MNKPRLIQQAARDDCTIKEKARRRSLGQVVSKMFGWPAEVFDSLGGGKLVYTTDPETGKQVFKAEFAAQAKALGLADANGNVIDHDVSDKITNYAASSASSVANQQVYRRAA